MRIARIRVVILSRLAVFVGVAALLSACTPRPLERRSDRIGAPSVGLASGDSPGPADGLGLGPKEGRHGLGLRFDERLQYVDEGPVVSSDEFSLTVAAPSGETLVLAYDASVSTIELADGRQVGPQLLEEGAFVRASYVVADGRRVAGQVVVLKGSTGGAHGDGPGE